ncbi:VRR-NUC domain-containing protein [Paenibacillus sp. HJGM_3]|uniref:VRR-NUC domain-containing protein n=1 Tax=Paenibacillus sp. HJGM_3 TaxID=3379816 RepID=UPI00385F43F6
MRARNESSLRRWPMRESTLERRLVRLVEELGGEAPKWVSPGNRGVPDRIVILPGGRTIYVEMKAPGKPLEPLQVRWARILRRLGHEVYKIDSNEDIDRFIAEVKADEV